MKKLCLILMFCLMPVIAFAGEHAEYIRIECHKMLGILDISFNHIYGSALQRIFMHNPEYMVYQDEKTDILLIDKSMFFRYDESDKNAYRYRCALIGAPENTFYDVLLNVDLGGAEENNRLGRYRVSIIESKFSNLSEVIEERRLVDNVSFGYGANVDRIVMTGDLDFDNLTFHFEKTNYITDIIQGNLGMVKSIDDNTLFHEEELGYKGDTKEFMRFYDGLSL